MLQLFCIVHAYFYDLWLCAVIIPPLQMPVAMHTTYHFAHHHGFAPAKLLLFRDTTKYSAHFSEI